MKHTSTQVTRRFTLTAFAALAFSATVVPAAAQFPIAGRERVQFTVDVAEDTNLFVEPRMPVGAEPLRGSFFVTESKIFPQGTIPSTNGEQFDPNAISGAIGTWYCKGTFLVRGSVFDKSSAAVLSDQLYLLPGDEQSISTTGREGNGSVVRTVTGGTGMFAGYIGEQSQQFLGFNKTGGVNLRVTITLRRIANMPTQFQPE